MKRERQPKTCKIFPLAAVFEDTFARLIHCFNVVLGGEDSLLAANN